MAILLHVLVGLGLLLTPLARLQLDEPPVTVVELIAPMVEPPSETPDAGEAKDEGGGGGGQAEAKAETEPADAPASEPEAAPAEPVVEVAELPTPQPTPDPVVTQAPEPAPQALALPTVPTPIKPRLAVLAPPADVAPLTIATPAPPAAPAEGFLSMAATQAALQGAGSGAGSGSGASGGSGSGSGSGTGQGSGSGTGSGKGSGSGTGNSAARGPGASCDMLARISQAVRSAPQVRAAVDALARDNDAVGQALIIWDGEWITTRGQDGRGLAGVRQAVSVTVAFAPAECKAEPVRGFVVINLGEGDQAPKVALGKSQWRWEDLLERERAR